MAHSNAGQTGSPAGGNFLGDLFEGAGAFFDATQAQGRINDVNDRSNFQDQGFGIGGLSGFLTGGQSTGRFGEAGQQLQNQFQGSAGSLLQGQTPFGQGDFQSILSGLNFGGALGQAQGALGQQAGSSGFQGFGGIAGPIAGQSLLAGFTNQQAAGNQQGLFDASLASQRAAAQPFQDRQQNRLDDRLFARGQLGGTGGAQAQEALFNAQGQQDLGFQQNAFGQSLAQGQFLGQLGSQQIGQGAALEGQQFGQNLQSLGFNSQQGQGQLGLLQSLLGQGSNIFNQGAQTGLGAAGAANDQQRTLQDLVLGLRGSETDRIGASGQSADALLGSQGSGLGGLLGGALSLIPGGGLLGGLFS